jgi:hypothetical protein
MLLTGNFIQSETDKEGNDSSDQKQTYEGASKSFRTGRMEMELQMAQLSANRCSCNAIL